MRPPERPLFCRGGRFFPKRIFIGTNSVGEKVLAETALTIDMTRKQALRKATEYLKESYIQTHDAELCKVIPILEELQNGIPGKIWDDENIRSAVERFIQENGRPPKVKELDTVKYLPPHPVVTQRYGMTAGKWLRKNYPSDTYTDFRSRYAEWTEETFKEVFISEFKRIKPPSQVKYDLARDKSTPTAKYIIKRLGVSTWRELKEKCDVNQFIQEEYAKPYISDRHIMF